MPQHTMQFLQECGVENFDRNILIPNNWDLKGILPVGTRKIGIKQHLLVEHVHGTSFVAMVTHQCKQQVELS